MSSNPVRSNASNSIMVIPSNSVVTDTPVDFPVFYRNRAKQYKRLLSVGNTLSQKLKTSLIEKSIEKLYIKSEDKSKYLTYLSKTRKISKQKSKPEPDTSETADTAEEAVKITRAQEVIVVPKEAPPEDPVAKGFVQKKTDGLEEIELAELTPDTVVDFALYYRGSDNAVKKALESGSVYSDSLKQLLEQKKVKQVFIRKEEQDNFKTYVQNNTPPFTLDESLPLEEKSRTLYSHSCDILQNLFDDPKCSWSYARAKTLVEYTVGVIASDKGSIKAFADAGTPEYNTHTHSFDVAVFTIGFGQHLGFDRGKLVRLGYCGMFHDLGKSQINPNILDKVGPLDDEEYEVVKKHSLYGNFIMRSHLEKDKEVLDAVKHHHERFDGTGYPDKLKGKDIPLFAQIVSIADAYDAISSKKSYRDAHNSFESLNIMKTEMCTHFDKRLLMEFIKFMGPQYSR